MMKPKSICIPFKQWCKESSVFGASEATMKIKREILQVTKANLTKLQPFSSWDKTGLSLYGSPAAAMAKALLGTSYCGQKLMHSDSQRGPRRVVSK